jgi:hypothetical protein
VEQKVRMSFLTLGVPDSLDRVLPLALSKSSPSMHEASRQPLEAQFEHHRVDLRFANSCLAIVQDQDYQDLMRSKSNGTTPRRCQRRVSPYQSDPPSLAHRGLAPVYHNLLHDLDREWEQAVRDRQRLLEARQA